MSDIVERLRAWETPVSAGYECPAAGQVLHEAADEIERLRAEVQTWVNHTKTAVWSDSEECKMLSADNEALRARVAELEAALQRIVDLPYNGHGYSLVIARAALAKTGESND